MIITKAYSRKTRKHVVINKKASIGTLNISNLFLTDFEVNYLGKISILRGN